MSYSYIDKVFPEFRYSNVYDTKLYENVSVGKPQVNPLENTNAYAEVNKIETFQDNQVFFNIPSPNAIPINNNMITDTSNIDHMTYTKHVLGCASCKQSLIKQFNIENDRLRNEEIMELISFIMFGLFILLFLDSFSK